VAEYQYPRDEFDVLAAQRRVSGAHRRQKSSAKWWIALIAIVVLAPLAGWGIVQAIGYHGEASTSPSASASAATSATATPSATATASPTPSATPTPSAAATTSSPTPTPSPTTAQVNYTMPIQVLNASSITGLAASKQSILQNQGFSSVTAGNYSYQTPAASQVYYPSAASEATAQAVAQALGIDSANLIQNANATGGDQIIVVLAGEL
jgi:cytoskeletal protein RodZ